MIVRDCKLAADGEQITDLHLVCRIYDLRDRRIVELREETFVPGCDFGSCAFTDGLATVSMVAAPFEYYIEYFPMDLMMISMMSLPSEKNGKPPVSV